MYTQFRKRFTSMILAVFMFAAMIPLSALPSSPGSMAVGAFDGEENFSRLSNTVNGMTLTATGISGRTITAELTGTPNTLADGAGGTGTAGSGIYIFYARATTSTGQEIATIIEGSVATTSRQTRTVTADATDSANLQIDQAITTPIEITMTFPNNNGSTTVPGSGSSINGVYYPSETRFTNRDVRDRVTVDSGSTLTNIRIYIGMKSRRLNVGTANPIPNGTSYRSELLTINDLLLRGRITGTTAGGSFLDYDYVGDAGASGSYTAWFENDSSSVGMAFATTTQTQTGIAALSSAYGFAPFYRSNITNTNNAVNANPNGVSWAQGNSTNPTGSVYFPIGFAMEQEKQTYHYYEGDKATGIGSWPVAGNPVGAAVMRVEFEEDPTIGGDIAPVNNVKATSSGALSTLGVHSFTVSINLNSLTGGAEKSGNHQVKLNVPAGYTVTPPIKDVFWVEKGEPVTEVARYVLKKTNSGNITSTDLAELSQMTVVFNDDTFYPDTVLEADANGVEAKGTARINVDAGMVNIIANIDATTGKAGTYVASITQEEDKPTLPVTLDDIVFNLGETSDARELKWVFDYTKDLDIAQYELELKLVFLEDAKKLVTTPPSENGITATADAGMNYNAGTVGVGGNATGTATAGGTHIVTLTGNTGKGFPSNLEPKIFRIEKDDVLVATNPTGDEYVQSLSWNFNYKGDITDLDLGLTHEFIADKEIESDEINGDVQANVTAKLSYHGGNVVVEGKVTGDADESGTYIAKLTGTGMTETFEKVIAVEKDAKINESLRWVFDCTPANFESLTLGLELEFIGDKKIEYLDDEKGVSATATVNLNYNAGVVTVTGTVTGPAGGYKVDLIDKDKKGIEEKIFNLAEPLSTSNILKWVFDYTGTFEDLDLNLSVEFYKDNFFEADLYGVKAVGGAKVMLAAETVDITVGLSGKAKESGNYKVSIMNGSVELESRIYYFNATDTTDTTDIARTIRLPLEFSDERIDYTDLNYLKVEIDYEGDRNLVEAIANNDSVTANTSVKASYDGATSRATATITLDGTATEGGNYRVGLKLDGSTIPGVEDRILYYAAGAEVKRTITNSFDFDGSKWESLTNLPLELVFEFVEDFVIPEEVFPKAGDGEGDGDLKVMTATGVAALSYDAQLVNIQVTLAGTPDVGNYRIKVFSGTGEDKKEIGSRTFRYGTDDATKEQRGILTVQIDATQDQLNSLSVEDLNLSVTIEFTSVGPIGTGIERNGVTLSGVSTHDVDTQAWTVTLNISGKAEVSGNHYIFVEGGQQDEIEGRYYYLKANESINRTLTFAGTSVEIPPWILVHDFLPDEPILTVLNEEANGNGVAVNGVVSKNYDSGTAVVQVTITGPAKDDGNYRLSLLKKPKGEEEYKLVDEPMVFRSERIPTSAIRYQIDSIDFNAEDLKLTLDFFPDNEIESDDGLPINVAAIASISYTTEQATIEVNVTDNSKPEDEETATFRVYFTYTGADGKGQTDARVFHSSSIPTGADEKLSFRFTIDGVNFLDIEDLDLELKIEVFDDVKDDINGITARGRVSVDDRENGVYAVVNVTLRTESRGEDANGNPIPGYVDETGYYTVSLSNGTDRDLAESRLYTLDSQVSDSLQLEVPYSENATLSLKINFTAHSKFIYEIDYYNEVIIFGEVVNYGRDILYAVAKDVSKLFVPAKAKWMPTSNGRLDVSKIIPKKADKTAGIYIKYLGNNETFMETYGVDEDTRVVENFSYRSFIEIEGEVKLTGNYIELKGRLDSKGLKSDAKSLYNVEVSEFINKTAFILEVLFGLDKGNKFDRIKRYGNVFIERLEPDEAYPFDADRVPSGTQGLMRIAAVEFKSRELVEGEFVTLTKDELDENYAKARFASLPLKFKVGAQPKAPKADPAKVGIIDKNPTIISGVNEKMGVVLKTESNPVGNNFKIERLWLGADKDKVDVPTALKKGMTIKEFDDALITSGVKIDSKTWAEGQEDKYAVKDANGNVVSYSFELRSLPVGKKLMSAKATLTLDAKKYNEALNPTTPEETTEPTTGE